MARLQGVLAAMPKEDAIYHMQRCIDAGLWVPDAKAAGANIIFSKAFLNNSSYMFLHNSMQFNP